MCKEEISRPGSTRVRFYARYVQQNKGEAYPRISRASSMVAAYSWDTYHEAKAAVDRVNKILSELNTTSHRGIYQVEKETIKVWPASRCIDEG